MSKRTLLCLALSNVNEKWVLHAYIFFFMCAKFHLSKFECIKDVCAKIPSYDPAKSQGSRGHNYVRSESVPCIPTLVFVDVGHVSFVNLQICRSSHHNMTDKQTDKIKK